MEEGLEEIQAVGVELNYDAFDIETIYKALIDCDQVPQDLKRHLYFLQSDQ